MNPRKLYNRFLGTVTAGLFLILPLSVIIIVGIQIWQLLWSPTQQLAALAGIDNVFLVQLALVVFILLLCFFAGLLIRTTTVTRFRDWLEINFLRLIPGYEFMRMRLIASFGKDPDEKEKPVLIRFGDYVRPGLLIENGAEGKSVVYVPDAPDISNGMILILLPGVIAHISGHVEYIAMRLAPVSHLHPLTVGNLIF